MPTVPAQSVSSAQETKRTPEVQPEAESQAQSEEEELLNLPDVPSGAPVLSDGAAEDISTGTPRKTKGVSLACLALSPYIYKEIMILEAVSLPY